MMGIIIKVNSIVWNYYYVVRRHFINFGGYEQGKWKINKIKNEKLLERSIKIYIYFCYFLPSLFSSISFFPFFLSLFLSSFLLSLSLFYFNLIFYYFYFYFLIGEAILHRLKTVCLLFYMSQIQLLFFLI